MRLFAAASFLALLPGFATADPLVTDVRLGLLAHAVPILGPRDETGVDVNGDVLFASPAPAAAVASVAPAYRWLLQPKPDFGFEANTAGDTSLLYFGVVWTADLDIGLWPDHAVFVDVGFGGAYDTGRRHAPAHRHLSLGSDLLFHPSLAVGYRLTQEWSVSLYYDHSSNGGLARYNDGLNNLGVRLGYRF